MTGNVIRGRLGYVLVTLALVAVLGFIASTSRMPGRQLQTGQGTATETPTPSPYMNTIYTAEAAIARSLARWPSAVQPYGEQARLVSLATYNATMSPLPDEWEPTIPVWVVGILGDGSGASVWMSGQAARSVMASSGQVLVGPRWP